MWLIRDIAKEKGLCPSVATIGFFDGVHSGHRFLIKQVQEAAASCGLASAVITFPEHPRVLMHPDFHPELLTTCDEKLELLAQTGIGRCFLLDFTPELAALSARQFMEVLHKRCAIQTLVIGYDHRFGHGRSEGFEDYVRHGRELGMEVLPAEAYRLLASDCPLPVCSSSIRRLLHEGDVASAGRYLGYPYFLNGTVVAGFQVGHRIGYPTANLQVDDPRKIVPARGVYAVRVEVDGRTYGGMLNIGCRPTLANGDNTSIEVHIFDFNADIYQHPMRLSFVRRIRAERKFASVEELAEQLHRDAEAARGML